MSPVVSVKNLTKAFGRHTILEECALVVEEGEAYGLVGLNGAGKTTLIRLLLGVLRADKGEIAVLGMIFVSLAMFGSYYVYDALSPLADVLKQQLRFSDLDIGFLQAIYSFPNIFTVLIGGFIIDRIGLRKSLMIFGVLCFIGPAITVASGHLPIMATGRLIFGMERNHSTLRSPPRWRAGSAAKN
jgi:energy-coupling factor transporter ATP-binding protein EcfA2